MPGSATVTGNVAILADSETNASATVSNSTGGFVGVGKANASTSQTSTTEAYVGGTTIIGAGGDVSVDATSLHITGGNARADAGGFAADVRVEHGLDALLQHAGEPRSGAKIVAAGHVGVTSDGKTRASTSSYADGRGFGGGGYANTGIGIGPLTRSCPSARRTRTARAWSRSAPTPS